MSRLMTMRKVGLAVASNQRPDSHTYDHKTLQQRDQPLNVRSRPTPLQHYTTLTSPELSVSIETGNKLVPPHNLNTL